MTAIWCRRCERFTPYRDAQPCPDCGYSRRGMQPVALSAGCARRDLRGDPQEVAHSHRFATNRAMTGREAQALRDNA